MATEYTCDCCNCKSNTTLKELKMPVHIKELVDKKFKGYIDTDDGNISGQPDKIIDLCAKCDNQLLEKTYNNFLELQAENKNKQIGELP